MIHHLTNMDLTEKLRESLQDSGDDLRFAAVETNFVLFADHASAWHWHEFVELAWVTEGALEGVTPTGTFQLRAGDGYFINANVLHAHRMVGQSAVIRVIHFVPALLAASRSIYGKYISPVEKCRGLEAMTFSPQVPGQRAILQELSAIYDLAEGETEGYELKIMQRLFHLWLELFRLARPRLQPAGEATEGQTDRVKTMLTCIHQLYAEPLTVADIAASAGISQREAFRCFRQVLGTTPTLYLLHHRIDNAARLLLETDQTVTEIALKSGFSNSSYMCKVFHEIHGMSPRAFRRRHWHEDRPCGGRGDL